MAPQATTAHRIEALRRVPEVEGWQEDIAVAGTRENNIVGLDIFLNRTGLKTPGAFLALAKSDPVGLRTRVNRFLANELEAGRSQRYSLNLWYSARSFLKFHNAAPSWNPKAKKLDEEEDEGADREVIPSFDQMRQIVNVLNPRARAAALLCASSGIRIGVLASQFRADGLRLRHLPELVLGGPDAPRFQHAKSFLIRVPKHLSKNGVEYVTFGNADAEDALLASLRARIAAGETLTGASPVIAADPRGHASERKAKDGTVFVSRKSLAWTIAEPMRRVAPPGVYWHTHLLRKWFSVQMEGCENRGLITKTRREFFMGHTSTDTKYNLETSEGVETLRGSYEACAPWLSLSETERRSVDSKAELRAEAARLREEVTQQLRSEMGLGATAPVEGAKTPKVAPPTRAKEQRSVDAESAQQYFDAGWTFVSRLNSHLAVVEWPGDLPH